MSKFLKRFKKYKAISDLEWRVKLCNSHQFPEDFVALKLNFLRKLHRLWHNISRAGRTYGDWNYTAQSSGSNSDQ